MAFAIFFHFIMCSILHVKFKDPYHLQIWLLKILTFFFIFFITYIPELVGTWKNGRDFPRVWKEDLVSMRNIWLVEIICSNWKPESIHDLKSNPFISLALLNNSWLSFSFSMHLLFRLSQSISLFFSDYHKILGHPGEMMSRMYYFCFWFHILQCSTWHCWGRWLMWLVSLRTLQRIHIRSSMLM